MNNADERLEEIKNGVKILLERQRLSRFDNLMLLPYPLIILSITLSLYMSVQYEALRSFVVSGLLMAHIAGCLYGGQERV